MMIRLNKKEMEIIMKEASEWWKLKEKIYWEYETWKENPSWYNKLIKELENGN